VDSPVSVLLIDADRVMTARPVGPVLAPHPAVAD
jgi:hypothetical protein